MTSLGREYSWVWALLVLCAGLSAAIILTQKGRIAPWPMDQSFASNVDLRVFKDDDAWQFHYPHLQHSGGITASLTVGAYKLLVPTTAENLNYHVKLFALLLYFGSGFLLAIRLLHTRSGLCLLLGLMTSAGFQFVEPSSELIAGAYFAIFLYGYSKNWHPFFQALSLVAFGLCKVELVFVALVVLIFWMYVTPSGRTRAVMAGAFGLWLMVLVGPSLLLFGRKGVSGDRALISLGHHYGISPNISLARCPTPSRDARSLPAPSLAPNRCSISLSGIHGSTSTSSPCRRLIAP